MKEEEIETTVRAYLNVAGIAMVIMCVDSLLYYYGWFNSTNHNSVTTALSLAYGIFLCYDVPRKDSKTVGLIMLTLQNISNMKMKRQ